MKPTSNNSKQNPDSWTDEQANEWFSKLDLKNKTGLQPHSSIDKKEFALRYHQYPERWEKAFAYLKENDLSTLEVGKYELDGKDLIASVFEYKTKNPEDARFEAHKIFTDIQVIVSGEENIGLINLSETSVLIPYDSVKDIAYYTAQGGETYLAKAGTFFLFFPADVHRPALKINDSAPVKKVVIKVRINGDLDQPK